MLNRVSYNLLQSSWVRCGTRSLFTSNPRGSVQAVETAQEGSTLRPTIVVSNNDSVETTQGRLIGKLAEIGSSALKAEDPICIVRAIKGLAQATETFKKLKPNQTLAAQIVGLKRDTLDDRNFLIKLHCIVAAAEVPRECPDVDTLPPSRIQKISDMSKVRNIIVGSLLEDGYRRFDCSGTANLQTLLATIGAARLGLLKKDVDLAFTVKVKIQKLDAMNDGELASTAHDTPTKIMNSYTFLLLRCQLKTPSVLLPYRWEHALGRDVAPELRAANLQSD